MEHVSHPKQFHFEDSITKLFLAGQTVFKRPTYGHTYRLIIKMKSRKNYGGSKK